MRLAAILGVLALSALPAGAACVELDARADWTEVHGHGALLDVHATGLWTADPALRAVGPLGHPAGTGGARVVPRYRFGALLIASEARRVWSYRDFQRMVAGALLAGQAFDPGRLYARINDGTDAVALADNAGSVTLCLEPAA